MSRPYREDIRWASGCDGHTRPNVSGLREKGGPPGIGCALPTTTQGLEEGDLRLGAIGFGLRRLPVRTSQGPLGVK